MLKGSKEENILKVRKEGKYIERKERKHIERKEGIKYIERKEGRKKY